MWLFTAAIAALALIDRTAAQSGSTTIGGLSGSHTNIPRWCGKPYEKGSPNFNPGGMLHAPKPSATPNLLVQVQPEHSIYDSSESTAAFLVSATLSYTNGQPLGGPKSGKQFKTLYYDIRTASNDVLLVSNHVAVGSEKNVISFDLSTLTPSLTPYDITLYGSPEKQSSGTQMFTATTQLYYLPAKTNGSTVKVDNLNGGLIVANKYTNFAFEPLLPFGFYTSCSTYLNLSEANVQAYKNMGFNAINPVCAFPDGPIAYMFDWLDDANLWFQYDMRGTYLNLTSVAEQVPEVKDRSAFLTYYTADEPDGWQYALNSTQLAYNLLKEQDPYHPVALVLNCDNYYFQDYSAGADYLMEDAYPIGINATFSRPYDVPCNLTYGDCGCDDCVGELQDVPNRLDAFATYAEWLGQPAKPVWAVLQAFFGEGYWARDPTQAETWAMMVLSFNHAAKGIMSWIFPASKTLNSAHAQFASVAAVAPVAPFLTGANPVAVPVASAPLLDVALWKVGSQVMVGVAYLNYVANTAPMNISLEVGAKSIVSQPWGNVEWTVSGTKNTSVLSSPNGFQGLQTSLVILDL